MGLKKAVLVFVWEERLDGREVLEKTPKRSSWYQEVGRSGFQKAMLL